MKEHTLILNKYYFPINVDDYKRVFTNIASGSQLPLDIHYEVNEDGSTNFENINFWNIIKSIDLWMDLPIRPYDNFIHTVNGPIRLPTVVICSTYKGIMHKRAKFPTKKNIWERDKYTCVYTGKKLQKTELSVDHVLPKSKGGKDSWDNLVTCDKLLNSKKSNNLLSETKLKLLYKPFKPADGYKFEIYREEWHSFLANF